MLSLVENLLEITSTTSSVKPFPWSYGWLSSFPKIDNYTKTITQLQGDRRPFVVETVKADDNAKLGMCAVFSLLFCWNL